ncbi:hypothetical protein C0389_08995 [bacterium]|nr:hypothetical protein [bacterium]
MNKIFFTKYYFSLAVFLLVSVYNQKIFSEVPDSLLVKDSETIRIDSIRISGNNITEDFIILRELTFQTGETVTGKTLRFNRERIYSLRLFNRVEFIIGDSENKNILEIHVSESWYLYPLPFVRIENSDVKKATYGFNILYKNFRGRNETLRAMAGFGYDPSYSLYYDNPAFFFENDIGFSIGSAHSQINNRSNIAKNVLGDEFKYKIFSQSISVSKRLNQFNIVFLSLGFNYIETPFSKKGMTASDERIDRLISGTINYIYDSRDLKQYSENGLYAFLHLSHKGFGINNISYNDFEIDFREYRNLFKQLSGKWRIVYRRTFGKLVPFYDYSYLGYGERVRGHYNDIREGKGYLLASFELSYPLVKEWNVSFKLPLLPESLTSARIGIYLSGFIDAGDTFDSSKSVSISHFYSGYGFGITLLFLPFNAIRFEYAFDELGRGEFTIGTGFSF